MHWSYCSLALSLRYASQNFRSSLIQVDKPLPEPGMSQFTNAYMYMYMCHLTSLQVLKLEYSGKTRSISWLLIPWLLANTTKTYHALPAWKCIFDNCLKFQTYLYKEVLLVLPYLWMATLLFHWSWTEDQQFLLSLSLDCQVISNSGVDYTGWMGPYFPREKILSTCTISVLRNYT